MMRLDIARWVQRALGNAKGFTLIEVLISTMVLGVIIYLGTLSYSMFLNIWGERRLSDTKAFDKYRSHMLLRSSLESVYDYYVTDRANERLGLHYPFFKGEKDAMEFVTLSSVFKKGFPAVARLRITKDDDTAAGSQRLVYEETPLDSVYIKYNDFQTKFADSMVLDNHVKGLGIRYFGPWTIWQPQENRYVTSYKWHDTFHGKEKETVPDMIEMTLTSREGNETYRYSVMGKNTVKQAVFRSK
jgi:prepilin-type N-terminal cleavage/methylation domain-containing protein